MMAAASDTDDLVIQYERQSEPHKSAITCRYHRLTGPLDFLKPGMMRVSASSQAFRYGGGRPRSGNLLIPLYMFQRNLTMSNSVQTLGRLGWNPEYPCYNTVKRTISVTSNLDSTNLTQPTRKSNIVELALIL